jgi:hypothetical protein
MITVISAHAFDRRHDFQWSARYSNVYPEADNPVSRARSLSAIDGGTLVDIKLDHAGVVRRSPRLATR